jgi:hypothetical protein
MGKVTIHSAKFLKEKAIIDYTEERGTNLKPVRRNDEFRDIPHPHLINAYKGLAVHAAIIAEFIPAFEIDNIKKPEHEDLDRYNVTGYHISGEDRDQLVLTGQKTLKTGKILTFNTPILRMTEDGDNAYKFAVELHEAVEKCQDRVRDFLNGTVAEDPQGVIQFPEDKVNKVNVLPAEKPVLGKFPSDSPNAITDHGNGPLPEDGVIAETDACPVVIPIKRGRKKAQSPDNPSGLN